MQETFGWLPFSHKKKAGSLDRRYRRKTNTGAVISQVKNPSKDSLSFLSGITAIGLATVHMPEKQDGIELRRGQAKNDQACRHYHGALQEWEPMRIGKFQGNIKGGRPLKGGGSVSGRVWNNDGRPLDVRTPKQGASAALFQGNLKAKRPEKGGGSVSGKLWNNKETPVPGKTYSQDSKKVGGYPGRNKMFDLHPGFADQGERFTGYIKLKKFKKNYVQHPDAAEESLKKKRQNKRAFEAEGLQVKVQRRKYVENKNTSEDALRKLQPTKTTTQAGELQVRVKQREYGKKPHAAEGSLPGIKPIKKFCQSK